MWAERVKGLRRKTKRSEAKCVAYFKDELERKFGCEVSIILEWQLETTPKKNSVAFQKKTPERPYERYRFLDTGGTKSSETRSRRIGLVLIRNQRRCKLVCVGNDIRFKGVSTQRKEPIEALSSDVVINGVNAYLSPLDWDRS